MKTIIKNIAKMVMVIGVVAMIGILMVMLHAAMVCDFVEGIRTNNNLMICGMSAMVGTGLAYWVYKKEN